MGSELSRRGFLKLASLAGLGSVIVPQELFAQYRFLAPVSVPNPLAAYPNRDWERIYRDIFRHDKTFVWSTPRKRVSSFAARHFSPPPGPDAKRFQARI